jgi:hypothetical protein
MVSYDPEKYKDPRWQKRRLEIFERDNWQCLWCGATHKQLAVHHLAYTVDDPWDAGDNHLLTVCQECHDNDHKSRAEIEKALLNNLKVIGISFSELNHFLSSVPWDDVRDAFRKFIREQWKIVQEKFNFEPLDPPLPDTNLPPFYKRRGD